MINADDVPTLVEFWSGFMEVDAGDLDDEAGIVWLRSGTPGGVTIGIQRVTDHPAPITHVHLDISVDDLDAATATIERLGGGLQKVNRLENGFEWRVVTDPAGHEFCIFVEEPGSGDAQIE